MRSSRTSSAHRNRRRVLSSAVARRAVAIAALAVSVAAAAASLTNDQRAWYRARLDVAPAGEAAAATPVPDPLAEAVIEWKRLRASDSLPFGDYARFLIVHPGWPGETPLRRNAERALNLGAASPAEVAMFFDRLPPLSVSARAKQADALAAVGRAADALVAARAAWTGGVANADDEARLVARFGGSFTPEDQDRRMEALLWSRATIAAARQMPSVSAARAGLYAARLSLQLGDTDADVKAAALGPQAARDPGYLIDRAVWLRNTGRGLEARAWLAAPRQLDAAPYDPERWLDALVGFAQAAATDSQWSSVLGIATLADATYPPATSVRDRPLAERDDYTTLVWLGGMGALNGGRPAEARAMFGRYADAARSPQTQSKGLYWAGRAARAGGDQSGADQLFAQAAAFSDQFYGQLAAERVGQSLSAPAPLPATTVAPGERQRFDARETVRVARLLGELGDWQDQSFFVRAIAQEAASDTDHLLVHQLARELGRPDLGVMTARAARQSGQSDYVRSGYPEVTVPASAQASWTMIHAISRQESQFDRQATSRVGARGMMQLMPGTAREQAGKLGLAYDPASLADPSYNLLLGAGYFGRMMDYYGGSYVLAVAAYNAGPGNVNRMIQRNGDPRLPGADVVRWIEQIPLTETRGYVQRVLENAVVYDLLNPARARMPAANRLSAYLGKQTPG